MERISILGIPIDSVSRESAAEWIQNALNTATQRHVMTPNNEMLVQAHRNPAFAKVLKSSDLNLPDSTGLVLLSKLKERVPGVDTVVEVCSCQTSETRVFLLGAEEGVAEIAALNLNKKNPELNIVGTFSGSPREEDSGEILEKINQAVPHLLLVAYGAPAQDMWIAKYLHQMPSVRVAMGVGGTFDFLAGKVRRAPAIFRRLGLEWLWRLILQPTRFKRIWNAVVVFPVLVMKTKLSS